MLREYIKSTFHQQDNKAHAVLERIHYDVYVFFSTTYNVRHKYFVIFIDDFSWKCCIFFMYKRDETFSKFIELKALVEKETGKKVKDLRSEIGGEYVSNEFKFVCSKEGI